MSSSDRKIISTAPGRAGIIGNPTDMYGGCVISCSTGMRATATITSNSSLSLVTANTQCEIQNEQDLELKGDRFDIVRAIFQYLGLPSDPFRLEFESTIPFRSGLSGSTALLVALLQGMLAWQDEFLPKHELAEKARFVETNYLKIVGGFQDAYMCVFGGLNFMNFAGKRFDQSQESDLFATVEPIELENEYLPFVLATTGVERVSGAVHRPLGERWLEGEPEMVRGYARISELAKLGKRTLQDSDWSKLGELMNENHEIQRSLGGSGKFNERLIAAAREAGALGAKLAGAGEGGAIVALWPNPDSSTFGNALRRAGATAVFRPLISTGVTVEIET